MSINPSPHDRETRPNSIASLTKALTDTKAHLLLAASGSVAVIKLPLILSALTHHPNLSIRIILTDSAARFFTGASPEQPTLATLSALPNVDAIYQDEDEWVEPWTRGADILHIQLRRWAHVMVVAPLSANTLAKIVGGMCDNLLTSVVRAWDVSERDGRRARIVVAPSMNSAMWTHPVTGRQMKVLEEEWGVGGEKPGEGWFEVLRPQVKLLACGDLGDGGMCDWEKIVVVIEERLGLTKSEVFSS